jgi:multisubunit Na+/H+ antiporter MnhB subunit
MFKLATVLIGLIATVLGCYAIFNSEHYTTHMKDVKDGTSEVTPGWLTQEQFFVAASIAFLVVSSVSLALMASSQYLLDAMKRSGDVACHIVGGLCILIGGIVLVASAFYLDETHDIKDKEKKSMFVEKVVAGSVGVLNSLVYFYTAWILYKQEL